MSDTVTMMEEEESSRRRTRSLSNDNNNNDTTTTSYVAVSSPPQQTNNAPPPSTTNSNNNIVILSLKDSKYKEILWTKFNILGRVRDNTREENVAYELWTEFIQQNVVFYRLERDGNRILLTNDEALERITRDIKRRIETVHNWYGKVASSSSSSTSNNNNKIKKKSREVESLLMTSLNTNGEKMNTSLKISATAAAATTTGTPQQQRKSPRVTEETKPSLLPPQRTTTLGNNNNNTNYPNNEHDTILSLYDAKYRNVMFKCFLELNKDDSKKKQMAIDIWNKFKFGGRGRFFKVERGGKSYIQVNDKIALQKITGDIGRRSETQKRWNIHAPDHDIHASTNQGRQVALLEQQAYDTTTAQQMNSYSINSPSVVTLPTTGMDLATDAALAAESTFHQDQQNQHLGYQAEEKKQEDRDVAAARSSSAFLVDGGSSSSNVREHHDVHVSPTETPGQDDGGPLTYPSMSLSFKMKERPSSNIVLSLNDEFYKDILWRHYRVLGKARDSEKEAELATLLFDLFKKELGESGKFFKQAQGQDVEVDDVLAKQKIIADIRRRMKNYRKWSGVPEPTRVRKPASSMKGPSQQLLSPPPSRTPRDRQAKVSTPGNENATSSPRRSTRLPTPNEDARNNSNPNGEDVVLSLNDAKYKKVLYKHYNMLGRKQPGDKAREESFGIQIFKSLKRSLGRSGRFFKKMSHGDLMFEVDDEGALQKITRDLKRRNESIHKWLGVSVDDSSSKSEQSQKQPSLPVLYEESMNDDDYEPLPITQEHAWRDQLAASPIEMEANYFPEPPARFHPGPVDTYTSFNEKSSHSKSNHVRKANDKPMIDQLMESHLGQRLPPLRTIPTINSVQTPNDLIHLLQHATHKLNELHGTHIKHCKVLRLYNMSEFNDHDLSSVMSRAPSLSELAEYMKTTQKRLKRSYNMYQNAVMGGFDFDQFGEDRIKDHGVFYGLEEVEESYQLSNGGERLIGEYLIHIGKKIVNGAISAQEKASIGAENGDYNLFAAPDPGDDTDPWNSALSGTMVGLKSYSQTGLQRQHIAPVKTTNQAHASNDNKSTWQINFERNQARVEDLEGDAIQLDSHAKRIKRGTKDRMLCMVKGCEKHAQTRSDGCCNAHFSLISSLSGKRKGKKKSQATSTPREVEHMNIDMEQTKQVQSLGNKRKFEHVYDQPDSPRDSSILNKLAVDSRIYVEWDGDNSLYKATVKKVFFDRETPMVKIHYDGKKRHILDNIPLEMVHSFIKGEKQAVAKQEHAMNDAQILSNDGTNGTSFPPLHKLYPGSLPSGKSEVMKACPDLGPGWHVHIVARKGAQSDGPRTDRYFIAPSGKKFRSVPEVERYYWQDSSEFDISSSHDMVTKPAPQYEENEDVAGQCQEVQSINQMQSSKAQPNLNVNCFNDPNNMPSFLTDFSPIYAQRGSNVSGFSRSLITISPITTGQSEENQHTKSSAPSSLLESSATVRHQSPSPKEVAALNNGNSNSAFTSPPRAVRPTLHHQLYQSLSPNTNRPHFPAMRGFTVARPQANHGLNPFSQNKGVGGRRPKRKLKSVTRFEEEEHISPYARSTKVRGGLENRVTDLVSHSRVKGPGPSKSALCHCPDCKKGDFTVQGIYAHYGRAHNGSLPWQRVTYSCPFCPTSKSATHRVFRSFYDLEGHVFASHPGCEVEGPHPSKLAGHPGRVRNKSSNLQQAAGDRNLRERRASSESNDFDPEVVAEEQGPPRWDQIEYVQLLPDGRKDYPSDLFKVIDMIDEQCQTQERAVEAAREQRIKLCKDEAETETKALAEERLIYQRGIRERARFAEAERMEKHRYTEKAEQEMMRIQYENRNKRRNKEDVAVEKLCSQPIKFSNESQRQNSRHGKACKDDQCQFCKKEKGYVQHLLLPNEIGQFTMDAPPTESPLFQKTTKLLKPNVRVITDSFFSEEAGEAAPEDTQDDSKQDASGGKRANQSRRDASTAKRLRTEEDKLLVLKNTKHSLEFIKEYNKGLIKNAWGDMKKDTRGRKSYK